MESRTLNHLGSSTFFKSNSARILTCTSSIFYKGTLSQDLHFTFLRMSTTSPFFNNLPSTVECFLVPSCLIKMKKKQPHFEVQSYKMGFHGDTEQNCYLFMNKDIVPTYSLPTDTTAQKTIYSDKLCPEIVLWVKLLTHEYKHH